MELNREHCSLTQTNSQSDREYCSTSHVVINLNLTKNKKTNKHIVLRITIHWDTLTGSSRWFSYTHTVICLKISNQKIQDFGRAKGRGCLYSSINLSTPQNLKREGCLFSGIYNTHIYLFLNIYKMNSKQFAQFMTGLTALIGELN